MADGSVRLNELQESTLNLKRIFVSADVRGVKALVISFPARLCVYDPEFRVDCLELMDAIRVNSKTEKKIIIDLTNLETMSASGAVALFAQITSVQLANDSNYFTFRLPKHKAMKDQIRASGLWDAIKSGGSRKLDKLWGSANKFQSGFKPDIHLDPTLKKLSEQMELPYKLKEAIGEAMLNIIQHAYPGSNNPLPRWWQYSTFVKGKREFIFVISDLGHTIPKSLKSYELADSQRILKAMEKGVSSTGLAHRGKGSDNIKKPVEADAEDKLIVISRNGLYMYTSKNVPPKLEDLGYPYHGTLVAWSFII